ncbi:cysteine desulfurase [Microbacterium foliorum]|uniref:cysteine desulfurase n=1 Tax=Microbacterium foliorum TaxID=104336 RepID=UPI001D70FF57|nr:cysteine desulfurase [Microbacterium foliorum]CAH0185225.1 putative cysteine desulfurase [Microbacterium foliorum]CAH0256106.1 putative cysteine desulfurase [Microbacterium foliorum]
MSTSRDDDAISPPSDGPLTDQEVRRLREDFPILQTEVHGHPLSYLDSGATSQRPFSVLDAEREFASTLNAAVHRGAHTLAAEATEVFEDARESVARFIGAGEGELVWTSNATEALNLIAYSLSNASLGRGGAAAEPLRLREGDEIVTTEMEHHANLIPWQELAARTGATLRVIPLDDHGALRLDAAAEIISARTRLIAVTHVSNVLGVINPVAQLVGLAREVGALVVLDACQSAPHLPLDVHALDVDFAVISGHKMLGPTGIGALYGRRELLEIMPPFLTGGSMITTVTTTEASYLPPPQRFEAGTQRVSQVVALAAAVDYLTAVGMPRIAAHEAALGARLFDGLTAVDGVRVLGAGIELPRVGLASFDVDGIHSHDVGQFLDDLGIAVRVGHHCAQPLHRRLGITSSTRASTYLYTTDAEVDAVVDGVQGAIDFFRRGA